MIPMNRFTVERLRRVYMLADTQGHVLQCSEIYDSLGLDSPHEIQSILQSGHNAIRIKSDGKGGQYLIRSGS